MTKRMKLLIVLSSVLLFLYGSPFYLYAQEKQDAKKEAKQHYLQGKDFYSQGRYQEATSEFEAATTLVTPQEMKFEQGIQQQQEKALAPGSSQEAAAGFKAPIILVTPNSIQSQMQFEQETQKDQDKVLAPATAKVTPLKKKLPEKKNKGLYSKIYKDNHII